jgi:hypothetical protein
MVPVERHARDRHEETVEEEAQRDHDREARAVDAEVGDDRLQERPHRVAYARRHERRHGKRRDDPPAVKDRAIGHGFSTIAGHRRSRPVDPGGRVRGEVDFGRKGVCSDTES